MKFSFIIVNYYSSKETNRLLKSIEKCYRSCRTCTYIDIVIIDNSSSKDELQKLKHLEKKYKSLYPYMKIRIYPLSKNYGYSGGVNIGVKLAKGEIIIVSNPDIVLRDDFLSNLTKLYSCKICRRLLSRSIIVPKLLLSSNTVNSTGMILHAAGYGILLNLGKKSNDPNTNKTKLVLAPHGALFISYRRLLLELGPFSPYYFSFYEDLDLGLKAYAKGYYVVYIPNLVARHYWGSAWGKRLSKTKYYYVERNRLLTILKRLPYKYIIIFMPYILISEIISFIYAILNKYPSLKIRVYADILRSLSYIRRERLAINECWIAKFLTKKFTHIYFDKRIVNIVNKIYRLLGYLLKN